MSQFRFKITEKDSEPSFSEWADELALEGASASATREVQKLRQEYPDASLSIERRAVKPIEESGE